MTKIPHISENVKLFYSVLSRVEFLSKNDIYTEVIHVPLSLYLSLSIYIYMYMGTQLISIQKESVNFCGKIENCNSYICIFAFIDQISHKFLNFETTMFDLQRKIWGIKTQNNLRNLFSPKNVKNIIS